MNKTPVCCSHGVRNRGLKKLQSCAGREPLERRSRLRGVRYESTATDFDRNSTVLNFFQKFFFFELFYTACIFFFPFLIFKKFIVPIENYARRRLTAGGGGVSVCFVFYSKINVRPLSFSYFLLIDINTFAGRVFSKCFYSFYPIDTYLISL